MSNSLSENKSKEYPPDPKYCKNCGKLITKSRNIFCDSNCCNEYRYKTSILDWKEHPEKYNNKEYPNFLRKYFFEKYGGCQICGWHEINPSTGKSPLQIHHIDGNCLNNDESNLQFLCPNCHSLTPNAGALNSGNSRRYKYKAYRKNLNDITTDVTIKEWKT